MLYRFKHDKFNDPKIFEDNRLRPRSYFIPFSSREACDKCDYLNERSSSDCVQVLSGEWDFVYYSKIGDMPDKIDFTISRPTRSRSLPAGSIRGTKAPTT